LKEKDDRQSTEEQISSHGGGAVADWLGPALIASHSRIIHLITTTARQKNFQFAPPTRRPTMPRAATP
jgi:hypothetical protein